MAESLRQEKAEIKVEINPLTKVIKKSNYHPIKLFNFPQNLYIFYICISTIYIPPIKKGEIKNETME